MTLTPTNIEWVRNPDGSKGHVWNPVTGCTKVSAGCVNCYAEAVMERFGKGRKFTDVRCHPERLEAPLRRKKPTRIFVNSMSDLFHEDVPDPFIAAVFGVMAACPQHTFMVLTKTIGEAVKNIKIMHWAIIWRRLAHIYYLMGTRRMSLKAARLQVFKEGHYE